MPPPFDYEAKVDTLPATLRAEILIINGKRTRQGAIFSADMDGFHGEVAAMKSQIAAINSVAEDPYTFLVHTPQPIP